MEALLDAGAGERGRALAGAGMAGRTAAAALLLDRGVDIHDGNDAALYFAAEYGHQETVVFLLDRGADPNAFVDWAEETCILTAARRNGHQKVVALLLARGAIDPDAA